MSQQRFPTIKSLQLVFPVEEDAKQARLILEMGFQSLLKQPGAEFRLRDCVHHTRMVVLNALDKGLCGVESAPIKSEFFDYLNAGDMYVPTIILWRGKYRVQDVGTFLERNERLVKK